MSKSTQPSKGRIICVVHRNNTTRGAHLRLRGGNREIGSCHFPLLIFHQTPPPMPDDKIHTSQQVKQVLLTLTRVSLTSSSLQERTPVWKWHKLTLQAEPSGRETHARGELFAHWDPALPAPQIYSYSIIYFVAFSWFLLFVKGEKCSITKIRLEAPTDPERRAKSQCSRLVQVKTQEYSAGGTGEVEAGAADGDTCVWMLGSEGTQDPCRRDWAKSKGGQLPVRWPGYQEPTMHGCKAPKSLCSGNHEDQRTTPISKGKWSVPTLKLRIKTT